MISVNRNLLGLLLYIYIFINIINESPNYQKKKKTCFYTIKKYI